jgi:hypothetical protein
MDAGGKKSPGGGSFKSPSSMSTVTTIMPFSSGNHRCN